MCAPGLIHSSHYVAFVAVSLCFCSVAYRGRVPLRLLLFYVGVCCSWTAIQHGLNRSIYTELLFLLSGVAFLQACFKVECDRLMNAMCGFAVLHSCICIIQRFTGANVLGLLYRDIEFQAGIFPISSVLGNPNYVAANLSMCIPLFFRKKWKYLLPLPIFVLLTSECLGAVVAAVAGGLCLVCDKVGKWRKGGLVGIGIGIALIAVFACLLDDRDLSSLSDDIRFEVWVDTIKRIYNGGWQVVLFGFGAGKAYTAHQMHYMHNDYFVVLYRYGMIGLGLLAVYITSTLYSKKPPLIVRAALLAACVNMTNYNIIQFVPSAMVCLALVSLADRRIITRG